MLFGIPQLIEVISAAITLQPGDIIATGTPAGEFAMHYMLLDLSFNQFWFRNATRPLLIRNRRSELCLSMILCPSHNS